MMKHGKKKVLREFFPIAEATPFSSQTTTMSKMSNAPTMGGAAGGSLEAVEDLLHKIMATETDQELNKIINKFLVDITPFMGG